MITESDREDKKILEDVQNGHTAGYRRIVEKYQARIYSLARGMCGNSDTAKDLAQDIFLKTFQKIGTFNQLSLFSTWLYRLARNTIIDFLRAQKKINYQTMSLSHCKDTTGTNPDPHSFTHSHYEISVLEAIDFDKTMDCLSNEYRELIILRHQIGILPSEIAAVKAVSVDSVKSKLKRARQIMERCLRNAPSQISNSYVKAGAVK